MMSQMEGGCPLDYNTITDLFLQRNLIREAIAFLLDVLTLNLPEHGFLQTKVLEINLVTFPKMLLMLFWLMACSAITIVLVSPNFVKKLVFMCELCNITLSCQI